MDVDIAQLQRTVGILERRISALLDEKAALEKHLSMVSVEVDELIFTRHTLSQGIRAVVANREAPEQARH